MCVTDSWLSRVGQTQSWINGAGEQPRRLDGGLSGQIPSITVSGSSWVSALKDGGGGGASVLGRPLVHRGPAGAAAHVYKSFMSLTLYAQASAVILKKRLLTSPLTLADIWAQVEARWAS